MIQNEESGYLLSQNPCDWAQIMENLALNPQLAKKIGEYGKKHVESIFGLDAFANQANQSLMGFNKK